MATAPATPEEHAQMTDVLAELLAATSAPFPPFEAGQKAQEDWSTRLTNAKYHAERALAQTGQAKTATVPSPEITVAVLTEAITELRKAEKLFPINLTGQSFLLNNGHAMQADGDTVFYSKNKVLDLLTKLHGHITKALHGSEVSTTTITNSNPTQDNPG